MMGPLRPALAIDYASLSEWRNHRACTDLGWQSYIGVRKEFASGEGITVAFCAPGPRGTIFSTTEKKLVDQLGSWVAAIADRERLAAAERPRTYPEAARSV
jgi:hypothetical protein